MLSPHSTITISQLDGCAPEAVRAQLRWCLGCAYQICKEPVRLNPLLESTTFCRARARVRAVAPVPLAAQNGACFNIHDQNLTALSQRLAECCTSRPPSATAESAAALALPVPYSEEHCTLPRLP